MNLRIYLLIVILSVTVVGVGSPGSSSPRNLSTEQPNSAVPTGTEEVAGKTYQVGVDANGILLPGDIWPAPGDSPVSTGANVVLFKYFEERVGTDVYAVMAQIYDKGDPTKGELATIVEDANQYGQSSISADGRFVAYSYKQPDIYNSYDIYLYDRDNPPAKKITVGANGAPANGPSTWPSISATGRYVAFYSQASNLVAGDNNGKADVFVYDRTIDKIALVSRNASGEIADKGVVGVPAISLDGLHIVYASVSANLDELVPNPPYNLAFKTTINPADLSVQRTEWISIAPDGKNVLHISSIPAISRDGRYIAFSSNSAQIYVRDTVCQDTTLISLGLDGLPSTSAQEPQISADGRFVVFNSFDNDLVENDANECSNNTGRCSDVFIHDYLGDHSTQLISATLTGTSGSSSSTNFGFSPDGRNVYFESYATDLIENQVPGHMVFLRRLPPVDPIPDRACPVKLTGRAIDRNGSPIASATVSVGPGQDTLTQNDGTFELTLTPGPYTVTVAKDGHSFTPASQTVELTQDSALGDFIGVADGGPVAPFLDLPFSYDGTLESFDRLMKNHSDEGQINSWFDHHYPKVWSQDGLWLYFDSITDKPTSQTFKGFTIWGYRDNWWYSGHDALDIERVGLSDWYARSAAAGTVKVSGNAASCNLGICVVIDHGNGYFTVYGHLDGVNVSAGDVVARGQEIGTIGCTGICSAPHLHFAVYRDSVASPGWNNFADEKVVDPFGWSFEQPDPWVKDKGGPVSTYLWLHDIRPSDISFDGAAGAELSDASQRVQVVVPAEYFAGQLSASLFPATVDRILMSLRPAGYSFRVKLLGQDVEEPNPLRAQIGPDVQTSGQIAISIDYSQSKLAHLDTSKLTLYRHDEESNNWLPLPTSVDTSQKLVQAETDVLGAFSLQAPLLCPSDTAEPDDVMFTAELIDLDTEYFRVFDSLGDEDWFRWDTAAAQSVVVQTTALGAGVRTVIEVYDAAGTLLATSESESAGVGAQFNWQAPDAGTYYIRVAPSATSSVGCAAEYKLTVQEQANNKFSIYLPSVTGGN